VYCHETRKKLSFSLGKYTTTFQAEVYAIKACAVKNIDRIVKMGISIFYQTVKLQLRHFVNIGSPQNWSGTATNYSYNWPDITGFN
jgi:hypothetical protein